VIAAPDAPPWPAFQQPIPATGRWLDVAVPGPACFAVVGSSSSDTFGDAALLFAFGDAPPTDDATASVATGFGQGILARGGRWWFKTLSTLIAATIVVMPRNAGDANPQGRTCDGVLGTPIYASILFRGGSAGTETVTIPANPRRQGFVIDFPPGVTALLSNGADAATLQGGAFVGYGFNPMTGAHAIGAGGAQCLDASGSTYPASWITFGAAVGFFINASSNKPAFRCFGPEVWKGSIGIMGTRDNGTQLGAADFVAMTFAEFI
jgi:hypothetical protein